MAIDQTQKRKTLAISLVQNTTNLLDSLNTLIELSSQYSTAGMAFVDADFAVPGLMQLDSTSAAAVFTSAAATKAWIDANFHTTNFEKARP